MSKILQFKDLKEMIDSRAKELEFVKYLKQFRNKTIVIKYGGSALETAKQISFLVNDLIFLKQQNLHVILIHGGSRQLNGVLKSNDIKIEAINGIRVTTKEVLSYAIKVFKDVNNYIVDEINKKGKGEIKAIGLNGHEIPITVSDFLDRGKYQYVGKIKKVNIEYLTALGKEYIPVLSSLSQTGDNQPLNVNADIKAAEIAKAIKAEKFIIMTDTEGILDKNKTLISSIDSHKIEQLIQQKIISEGMVPKVEACLSALKGGVKKVHIINGTQAHSLVREIFTDEGVGTQIMESYEVKKETHA